MYRRFWSYVELPFVVGSYALQAMAYNSFELQLDEVLETAAREAEALPSEALPRRQNG